MSRPMTTRRIRALRLMAEEFLDLLEQLEPHDEETGVQVAILGGALAGFVPELLDEIQRLRQKRPDEPARVLKMDRQVGSA